MTSSAELRSDGPVCSGSSTAEGRSSGISDAGPAASPGLARALHRAVRDLRLAGLAARRHPSGALPGRAQGQRSWRFSPAATSGPSQRTGSSTRPPSSGAGRAGGGAEAVRTGSGPSARPDSRLSRLERDLVRAAAGDRLVLVPGDPVFGLERPAGLLARPRGARRAPEAGRLSWLFDPRAGSRRGRRRAASTSSGRSVRPTNAARSCAGSTRKRSPSTRSRS
ncbi:MAG: hypothetical protein M0C28_07105 [Candidatus Moduliflexus flocculans]|nr:hypothetical protein [Candidatus Moduliflexus flocculans]